MLNQQVQIGTDIATLYLFHPDDLAHRWKSRMRWEFYEFAGWREFAAGSLIAWQTGGDGTFDLRLTDGAFSEEEDKRKAGAWGFRYEVRVGEVLLDNGDHLPSDEGTKAPPAKSPFWVTLPKGRYKVTVHAIKGDDEALPNYVVQFQPITDFSSVPPVGAPPHVFRSSDRPPTASEPWPPLENHCGTCTPACRNSLVRARNPSSSFLFRPCLALYQSHLDLPRESLNHVPQADFPLLIRVLFSAVLFRFGFAGHSSAG